jgi:hypothetical protein
MLELLEFLYWRIFLAQKGAVLVEKLSAWDAVELGLV